MNLFSSVIWPAVAGNVAWAFFSVLVLEGDLSPRSFYFERLGLLAIVAAYLFLDWTHTEKIKERLKRYYWIADMFLAAAIAALAVAAQALKGDGRWFLLAVYLAAVIGHVTDSWVAAGTVRGWGPRLWWVGLYGVASLIAAFGGTGWGWHLVVSVGLVVLVWILVRYTALSLAACFRQ